MLSELKTPQSRTELILHDILGADYELHPSLSRWEKLFKAILNRGSITDKLVWNESILHTERSGFYIGYNRCWCRLVGVSDAESFSNAVSNSLKVVYPLAEPQTYQLTPQEVSLFLGSNVIFSDANDDVTVRYWGIKQE